MEKIKLTDKMKTYALETLAKFIICPLIGWARNNEGAFFFIVIGDENQTDVAYYNTNNLSSYGAAAIAEYTQTAAAFKDIELAFDILVDENLEEKRYEKYMNDHTPSDDDEYWISTAIYDFDGGQK